MIEKKKGQRYKKYTTKHAVELEDYKNFLYASKIVHGIKV